MAEDIQKKKPVYRKPWFWIALLVVIIIIAGVAGSGNPEDEAENQQQTQSDTVKSNADETQPSNDIKLNHGELLSLVKNDGVIVIKAKITSSYSNKATIEQNYFNVEKYIKDVDMDGINELQYWAVADMKSGEESKVISFTVPKQLISRIKEGSVAANKLGDYVTDLWILPSLRN